MLAAGGVAIAISNDMKSIYGSCLSHSVIIYHVLAIDFSESLPFFSFLASEESQEGEKLLAINSFFLNLMTFFLLPSKSRFS